MEIMQLNYFKAVAQYGSFTKAADVLHVTQSALSRSIAALEQDIGFPLFERKGNHIFLTMDGQAFLTAAIEALNLLSSSVDATRARAGLEYGAVRIGIAESVFLKNIVRDFLLEHPNVHIFCKILSEGQIQRSLEEGEINFAVTRERPVGPKIQWEEIFTDRMMVRFPPTIRWRNGTASICRSFRRNILSSAMWATICKAKLWRCAIWLASIPISPMRAAARIWQDFWWTMAWGLCWRPIQSARG